MSLTAEVDGLESNIEVSNGPLSEAKVSQRVYELSSVPEVASSRGKGLGRGERGEVASSAGVARWCPRALMDAVWTLDLSSMVGRRTRLEMPPFTV